MTAREPGDGPGSCGYYVCGHRGNEARCAIGPSAAPNEDGIPEPSLQLASGKATVVSGAMVPRHFRSLASAGEMPPRMPLIRTLVLCTPWPRSTTTRSGAGAWPSLGLPGKLRGRRQGPHQWSSWRPRLGDQAGVALAQSRRLSPGPPEAHPSGGQCSFPSRSYRAPQAPVADRAQCLACRDGLGQPPFHSVLTDPLAPARQRRRADRRAELKERRAGEALGSEHSPGALSRNTGFRPNGR